MLLRAKFLQLEAEKPIVILNKEDAEELGVKPIERVEVDFKGKKKTFFIDKETYNVLEMV